MRKYLMLLFAAVMLGCATKPTAEQAANADYGPSPHNSSELAEIWVKDQLVDPYSAKFEHASLRKGYTSLFGKHEFGWIQCGTVNSKSRAGGYVGWQAYFVTIRYGKVVTGYLDSSKSRYIHPVSEVCSDLLGRT